MSDWRLSLRLLRGAGRREVQRLVLMTVGIALAVSSGLVGFAAPRVSADAGRVEAARSPTPGSAASAGEGVSGLAVSVSEQTLGDRPWTRVVVSGVTATSPLPPGMAAWPQPGHSIVSPALARLDPRDAPLGVVDREPLDSRGLTAPDELYSWTVAPGDRVAGRAVSGFGRGGVSRPGTPTRTLLIEAVLLVGMPALLFLGLCLRLSLLSRSDRAFRLTLAGLSPSRNARLFRQEMTLVSTAGAALGLGLYAVAQGPLGRSGWLGVRWFPHQAAVGPITSAVVLLLTVLVVRRVAGRVMTADAGRSRSARARPARRLLGVGAVLLAVPAIGALVQVCLAGLLNPGTTWADGPRAAVITVSICLTLVGVAVGVPMLLARLGGPVADAAPPAVRLGLRTAAARVSVTGKLVAFVSVTVVLAGLGAGFLAGLDRTSTGDATAATVSFALDDVPSAQVPALAGLAGLPLTVDTSVPAGGGRVAVQVGNCAGVGRSAELVFGRRPECRDTVQRGHGGVGSSGVQALTVGTTTVPVPPGPELDGVIWDVKIPFSGSDPLLQAVGTGTVTLWVSRADGSYAQALALVHRLFPLVRVDAGLKDPDRYVVYRQQLGVIHAGLALGLVLALASFLLAAVEIRWSGLRSTTALVAVGAPTRTLRLASSVQFAVPVLLGGLVALVPGVLGGWGYLSFFGTRGMFDPAIPLLCTLAVALTTTVAAAVGWACGAGRFDRTVLADR